MSGPPGSSHGWLGQERMRMPQTVFAWVGFAFARTTPSRGVRSLALSAAPATRASDGPVAAHAP